MASTTSSGLLHMLRIVGRSPAAGGGEDGGEAMTGASEIDSFFQETGRSTAGLWGIVARLEGAGVHGYEDRRRQAGSAMVGDCERETEGRHRGVEKGEACTGYSSPPCAWLGQGGGGKATWTCQAMRRACSCFSSWQEEKDSGAPGGLGRTGA